MAAPAGVAGTGGRARGPRRSAGLLLHRPAPGGADGPEGVEVLVAHMGGPFWARRDERAWSLPKGEPEEGEDLLAAARREFTEELGLPVPPGEPVALGEFRQSGGKVVSVWALAGDLDVTALRPGTFALEHPPGSGRVRHYPEVDRAAWVAPDVARAKLVAGQVPAVDRLLELLAAR